MRIFNGRLRCPLQKTVCPYCFEPFYLADCRIVSEIDPGKEIDGRPTGIRYGIARFWTRLLAGTKYTNELATRECPNCKGLLPKNIDYIDNKIIALVGGTLAGKSHYIASLIRQIEYEGCLKAVGCTEFRPLTDDIERRYLNDYYTPLFDRIQPEPIEKSSYGVLGTPVKPLGYTMAFRPRNGKGKGRRLNLFLFDVAGELVSDQESMARINRYVRYAAGIIFLVDPQMMPNLELPSHLQLGVDKRPGPEAESFRVLNRVKDQIRRQKGIDEDKPIPVPIALAVSKSDLFKYVHDDPDKDYRHSSFMRRPDYSAGFRIDDINIVNDEAEELLNRYGGDSLVQACRSFTRRGYFAVSALGNPPDERQEYPKRINPTRCVDPLLWVLWQLGAILPEYIRR